MLLSSKVLAFFDYQDASPTGSWSPPSGMLTRYGDVTPLLHRIDDMFVIFGPGDELALQFDAGSLPALPSGWVRSNHLASQLADIH